MGGKNNYYVVFRGRKVGIFTRWIECHNQVVRFKGSAFEGYETLDEAEAAWANFCNDANVPEQVQVDEEGPTWTPGTSTRSEVSLQGLTLQDDSVCREEKDPVSKDFLIEYSNQALLVDVCESLQIPPPNVFLLDTRCINGVPEHRYGSCVSYGGPGAAPVVMVGEFKVSHEEGRDSASWFMLHHLVGKVGKRVKDFNYHLVDELTAELSKKNEQIATMAGEIAILEHEIRTLKGISG